MHTFSTVNTKLTVGTNDHVLTADSTVSEGIKWKPVTNYWQRQGVVLSPTTSGDNIQTTGNLEVTKDITNKQAVFKTSISNYTVNRNQVATENLVIMTNSTLEDITYSLLTPSSTYNGLEIFIKAYKTGSGDVRISGDIDKSTGITQTLNINGQFRCYRCGLIGGTSDYTWHRII